MAGANTVNGVFPNTAFIFWSLAGIISLLCHEEKVNRNIKQIKNKNK
jgi:hypothetical protein